MDLHSLSIKIIFDKIVESCNELDKVPLIIYLKEFFEKIKERLVTEVDFSKLQEKIDFLGEKIRDDTITLIKNSTDRKLWVSHFLRIISQIGMIAKDVKSKEYVILCMIMRESELIATEAIYVQNPKITDDLYLLSVAFLNADYFDVHNKIRSIYENLPEDNDSFIYHFVKGIEKLNKDNSELADKFLGDFVNLIGFTKSLFGIKKENSTSIIITEKKITDQDFEISNDSIDLTSDVITESLEISEIGLNLPVDDTNDTNDKNLSINEESNDLSKNQITEITSTIPVAPVAPTVLQNEIDEKYDRLMSIINKYKK